MNTEIRKILLDLYKIDPTLKAKESEILKVVNELLKAKPDTKFDETFREQLRARIMQKIAAMPPKEGVFGWFTVPRFAYAMGGLAVLALIALPALYFGNKGIQNNSKSNITKLAAGAFGKLAAQQDGTVGAAGREVSPQVNSQATDLGSSKSYSLSAPAPSSISAPLGMGGGGSGSASAGSLSVGVAAPDVAVSPKMMPIRATNYKFVYKGGDLPSLPDNIDVLKRVTGNNPSALSLLGGTGMNFIDWSKFSNTKLQNLTFTEDRKNGYTTYINFDDGSVSISRNWDRWISKSSGTVTCMAIGCVQPPVQPIKISDVPADATLIEMANNFLKTYGISSANYGQPFIQSDWRIAYDAAPDKSNYYLPDQLSVIYPMLVNGQEIYDESGNKSGLNVTVDIREMAVTSVWNLTTQNYQASSYDTEKDSSRIIKLAENGGFRQIYYYGNGGDQQEISLGTPTLGLVQMSFYRDNQNQQLLIPSYIFPITNKPAGVYYYQDNIIVPVVKDVLDWGNNNGGGIRPMMEGAVEIQPAPAMPLVK